MTTPQQVSPLQVAAQGMVSVMSVSIVATAMNVAMGSIGASAYSTLPTELKGTNKAVADLKLTFGSVIVDKAMKNVGKDNMLMLAKEIEKLTIADMEAKYGKEHTKAALMAAPPGDFQSALIIAQALTDRGYGRVAPEKVPAKVVEQVQEVAKKRKHFKAQPQKDTHTNIVYKSKAQAGMAVAAEYALDSADTYVWFAVLKQDPNRFVPATPTEIAKLPKS